MKTEEDNAAKAAAEGTRTDMYDSVMAGLAEDEAYQGMTTEQQAKAESRVSDAVREAALVETGGKDAEDMQHATSVLYERAGGDQKVYEDMLREYTVLRDGISPDAKKAEKVDAIRKSGYSQEKQALYYMAMMGKSDKTNEVYKKKGMEGLKKWYNSYSGTVSSMLDSPAYTKLADKQKDSAWDRVQTAAAQAALVDSGIQKPADMPRGYRVLYTYAGKKKGKDSYEELVRDYVLLGVSMGGGNPNKKKKMAALEKSGYGKEKQALYYMAMTDSEKCDQIYRDKGMEGLVAWYGMQKEADTDGNGSISKKERTAWLNENIMNDVLRQYIDDMMTTKKKK